MGFDGYPMARHGHRGERIARQPRAHSDARRAGRNVRPLEAQVVDRDLYLQRLSLSTDSLDAIHHAQRPPVIGVGRVGTAQMNTAGALIAEVHAADESAICRLSTRNGWVAVADAGIEPTQRSAGCLSRPLRG